MKSNERTLTNLLNLDRRVYLYFANAAVWDIFVKHAAEEGFLWMGNEAITKNHYEDIIAMNNNMTFNYIGFVGHMRFGATMRDLPYRLCEIHQRCRELLLSAVIKCLSVRAKVFHQIVLRV